MNETIVSYFEQFTSFGEYAGVISFLIFFLAVFIVVNVMALVGGLGTYAERKISADIQMRQGPNRVGPYGILQFLADGIKMILKEDTIPKDADKFVFMISPTLALVGVFAALAVVPWSSGWTLTDLNIGVVYLLGVTSLVGVAVLLGGYSSNSKWSMLGGMRGASQIISYEIPVTISILAVILLSGTMSFNGIVNAQGAFPHQWYLFHNPFTFIGFFVYFVGALAEANRAPFDLPEAESELVSGYHTEYSGMRFGIFALAEYIEAAVLCAIAAALFLGGYQLPAGLGDGALLVKTVGMPAPIASLIGQFLEVGCFVTKTFVLFYIVIWVRWTLPRLRVDQLMTVCWKYLTPIALFNLVGAAVWLVAFDGKSMLDLLLGAVGGHGAH